MVMKTKGKPFVMSESLTTHKRYSLTYFRTVFAHSMVWTGYGLSFLMGLTLWPFLMEAGYGSSGTSASVLLTWFCLPITIGVAWITGAFFVNIGAAIHPIPNTRQMDRNIRKAYVLGIIATMGSCSLIASGFEPPAPFHSVYQLQLGN